MRLIRFVSLAAYAALSLTSAGLVRAGDLSVVENSESIVILQGGQEALVYRKAPVPAPAGETGLYARSGFIHPLRTPAGVTVTSIHAPDHIHHMGLWHAWVKTQHKGREIDFWNLKKGQGAVRYAETLELIRRPNSVGFSVRQEHVAFVDDFSGEVILEEVFTVELSEAGGVYFIDYQTRQTNVTEDALELPAYRYGGPIAYRGPVEWTGDNSFYLTSEGLDRDEGHATRGRWCAMYGPSSKGTATVAILCHPENHDAPQRMRIWPSRIDGNFFNYVPIQEHAWSLEPGVESVMRYRVAVFDSSPDSDVIEKWWQAYAR